VELGQSDMSGTITYYDPGQVPNSIQHQFPLLGINAQFQLTDHQNLYGGWSQAYRPVIFKDIIPASLYEKSDKNLKDAYGYNMEVGYRGTVRNLQWDVGLFQLQYNNRLGVLSERDPNGVFYLRHTNIGNSISRGMELFGEYSVRLKSRTMISFFTSTALMQARYVSAVIRSGDTNVDISGNSVEAAPKMISRNGVTLKYHQSSVSLLYSYTGESYADALNTITPSANGSVGIVPSYGLVDMNISVKLSARISARFNVNNAFDQHYFTKRPTFYPGPGVWSSDGRSFMASFIIRID
jgi:Fe(3+) dicitrate transport protein